MSASSKKKFQKEQNAAKMTERQLQEQKEAKKLKIMTVSFTAVLALILVVAIAFSAVQFVNNSGIREKNTVAATIGNTELSNAQLNYYYVDAVYDFANTYGSYASLFGLDLTKPLDEQVINEETGMTWADDFTTSALNNAQSTIALVEAAKAEGFTLTEEQLAEIENNISTMELYASLYGYAGADEYIQAYYGHGASIDSFREYSQNNTLAQAYYTQYANSLTYDDAALRAEESGKEAEYSNFSYSYYYLNVSKFLTGGTTNEDGTTTYSDEEKAAAVAAAEEAAKALTEATDLESLNAAIAALAINAEAETVPTATTINNYAYANVTSGAREWITDSARVAGEIGYVKNATTTTNEDGTETETVNGYYVVLFQGVETNNFPLANVRHILIAPEGGTYDSSTGKTTYTAEEMAGAKVEAEALLADFLAGEATEDAFAALATKHTADTASAEVGGLYEDIYPGQMVTNFNDWCFAEGRQVGDTGIVESEFGYHIMFYSSNSTTIYRNMLIENALRSNDTAAWYQALVESCTITEGNTKYLSRNMKLSTSN